MLGGAITDVASWRDGFMLSVVLGVVTVVLGFPVISRARYGRPARPATPDFAGAGLSVLTLAALVYGLIESATLGWGSPLIIGALVLAVAAAAGFIASQHAAAGRGRQPLMPLELWRSPRFIGANLSALAYFVMLYGILYFYSIDLQQYKHYSTLAAGLTFLPMTILMALLGPVAGWLSARFSTTPVLVAGRPGGRGGIGGAGPAASGRVGRRCGMAVRADRDRGRPDELADEQHRGLQRGPPPQRGRVRHPQHVPPDRRDPGRCRAGNHRRRRPARARSRHVPGRSATR